MKAIVVYESFFHNTEAIAQQVAAGLGARAVRFEDCKPQDLTNLDLLVVGSPTQRFRPTDEISRFLSTLPAESLAAKRVAAFDTRMDTQALRNWLIRTIVSMGGYAAPKLLSQMQQKGAVASCPPEGFLVSGQEGPLKSGELERANAWGKALAA